jgi:hypothetical protein
MNNPRIPFGLLIIGALCLTGCQTTGDPEDPIVWGRFDCKRHSQFPELAVEWEQAKLICGGRAQAAAVAGTAAMPGGYGMSGAIAAGINQGIAGAQISQATATSCMAERGYRMSKASEFDARCPIAPVVVATAPPVSTPRPKSAAAAKPAPAAKPTVGTEGSSSPPMN